ncbi:DapH/DapD/GlmU-related protein [Janibacter sp. GXQ6167]|uniref:acyltransferase n=1 Tax=Janibacter sp. GXQ6167 TaxID=3240791 RepID=UPI003523B292
MDPARARLWWQRWRWLGAPTRWPYRARLGYELARRGAFARGVVLGEPLQMLREGRLRVGEHVIFEPWVWLTGGESGSISIGDGTIMNVSAMVASLDQVSIGKHCMLANGCFVSDADHKVDDPDLPITWQGFVSKGPTSIGDNCWLGVNSVVTSGVTIGERCIVAANSVVKHDVPPYSIVAGAPARIVGSTRPATRQP